MVILEIDKDWGSNPTDLEEGQHCPVDALKYHLAAQPDRDKEKQKNSTFRNFTQRIVSVIKNIPEQNPILT